MTQYLDSYRCSRPINQHFNCESLKKYGIKNKKHGLKINGIIHNNLIRCDQQELINIRQNSR